MPARGNACEVQSGRNLTASIAVRGAISAESLAIAADLLDRISRKFANFGDFRRDKAAFLLEVFDGDFDSLADFNLAHQDHGNPTGLHTT